MFGRILYFLEHTSDNLQPSVIACIETYNDPTYDADSGLWHCSASSLRPRKSYVKDSDLSHPLVTATENERKWFINTGRQPSSDE